MHSSSFSACTRITLAVNPPHSIWTVIIYLLLCTRVYQRTCLYHTICCVCMIGVYRCKYLKHVWQCTYDADIGHMMKLTLKAHIWSRPIPHARAVIHVCLCSSHSLSRPTPHAGAGRHLLQVGQAAEDTLRHARQLVNGQNEHPVGMTDMRWRIQLVTRPVAAVSPWMGNIAIGTLCTRTRMKWTFLFIITFIHFYIMHLSRYQSSCCIYCACTKVWIHYVIVHINTFTLWSIHPYAPINCLPTPHARSISDDKYTCDIVSTHTRKETSTLNTHSSTHTPPPSQTLLPLPPFMYLCMCTSSGMNIYVLAPITISPDSLWSMICYQSISPSMHGHIDISIEHVEPHAMRYAHVLVITQIKAPVDMPDMTWPIPLLGDIAIGIYWNDAFLFFLLSQTHTRITLAVNPPHPIPPVIFYPSICSCIRTFELPFALSPWTARKGRTTLTTGWSSRWRRSLARSWAGSRPAQAPCGHARHELTNAACRYFRCVYVNKRTCNRRNMYTPYIAITSFIYHCIHTFLPHVFLQASTIWALICIYCGCTTVWNHHVKVHINIFTWWNIYPYAPIHCLSTPHARSVSYDKYTCNILSTHTRHTKKHAEHALWHRHAPPSQPLLPLSPFMYSCMCTRSSMNMYVLTHVSISLDSLCSMLWAYRSISPSMHRHIDISIEHVEPHAMRYTHALVSIQINPPVDMPDMTWPIPLLADNAIGIYWNCAFLLFLVSPNTHTHHG